MNLIFAIFALLLLGCSITVALTPLCRNLSHRFGLVDSPDQLRKRHATPVSRLGGVAIFSAVLAASAILAPFDPLRDYVLRGGMLVRLIPAIFVVFMTGLLDDIFTLKPWQKITGQLLAAGLACAAGAQIEVLAGVRVLQPLQIPVTMLWLVGCANAFNLIDGVDGLATGVGLVATLTTFAAALLDNNLVLALALAPVAGALLGFLRYNFNPATIFLGDCGSISLGFLLGCAGVIWSQKSATLLGITAPLIALAVPIVDTALSIARRFLRGQPIFGADRRHIHHLLLDRGLTPRRVALLMYGVAGIAATCSLMVRVSSNGLAGLIVVLFCIATWIGVQRLGYGEFQEARDVLFGGMLGRVIDARVSLRQMDDQLGTAQQIEQRWAILTDACRMLGFKEASLDFDGRHWKYSLGPVPTAPIDCWQLRVPLNGSGHAQFSVPFELPPQTATIAPFVEIVHRRLLECPHAYGLHISSPSTSALARLMAVCEAEEVVDHAS